MLPSQRIKEMFKAKAGEIASDSVYLKRAFGEIGNILDEIYCKHTDSYRVEGTEDVYYNVCNDCGVLFLGTITYQVTKK